MHSTIHIDTQSNSCISTCKKSMHRDSTNHTHRTYHSWKCIVNSSDYCECAILDKKSATVLMYCNYLFDQCVRYNDVVTVAYDDYL